MHDLKLLFACIKGHLLARAPRVDFLLGPMQLAHNNICVHVHVELLRNIQVISETDPTNANVLDEAGDALERNISELRAKHSALEDHVLDYKRGGERALDDDNCSPG